MKNLSHLKICLLSCFVSLGGFIYGYDSGVISTVLEMKSFREKFDLSQGSNAAYAIVPVSLAASFIASFASGFLADSLGRKNIFYIASIIHEVGCIVEIITQSQAGFFAGRIITGLAIGTYSMIVPLYQSEIALPQKRGTLITFYQIFVTLGFFIAFWLGYGTYRSQTAASYLIPVGFQAVAGFLLLVGTYFIPESPRWLIYKNKNTEAFNILCKLRMSNDSEVLMEYTGIVQDISFEKIAYTHPFRSLLKKGTDNNRKRTLLGMGVHTFTQFTGINAILFYLPHLLESAGMKEVYSALLGNGVGGAVNFIATLFVPLFIDKWDRRFILIWGAIAMSIGMIMITIVSALFDQQLTDHSGMKDAIDQVSATINNKGASYAVLVLLCVFIAFFALSWGPIGWIYPAEIYPQMIRANAMGVTTSCSYLFSLFVSLAAPVMFQKIAWGTYLFFGIMCLIMAFVVHKYYPETRGRSLEEIQLIFSGALLDQNSDAHHPATAAEALIHFEQIKLKNERDEFQQTLDLDWGNASVVISSPIIDVQALNHRNSSTASIASDKQCSASSLDLNV